MAGSVRFLLEELPQDCRVFPATASATGAALVSTVDTFLAQATGTALNATITIGRVASAGIATATGTARTPSTLPINAVTIQAVTTVGPPTQLVLVEVSTISATTALDAISSLDGYTVASVIAAVTSLDVPVVLTIEANKWTFYDPETEVTYTFEISPQKGNPTRSKTLLYKNTRAPSSQTLAYETGRIDEFSWSGTILTEDEYNEFVDWFNKRYPITVTDDLGRSYSVYLTDFSPKRVRSVSHPWHHTYDMTAAFV